MNHWRIRCVAIIVVLFSALGLWSCRGKKSSLKTVAIATWMSHPALDQVEKGIKLELSKEGWNDGVNIRYLNRNANQQMTVVSAIANDITAQQPDVVVGITTPMAQALKKVVKGPFVFAAVTDPVGAGLVSDLSRPEAMVTGTVDAWPYRDQLALIREILPRAKTLGVLYNPGEAASKYGIEQIRRYAPDFSFSIIEASANSVAEVVPAAQSLIGRVDALFLSSDNTVIGGATGAIKVAIEHHKPLFAGDSGTVKVGALASVSVGYEQLGIETGRLVSKFLQGEKNLPVVVAKGSDVYLNRKSAELMGVTLPQKILDHATKIYDAIGQ